jgi:hypothetical protein
MATPIDLKKVVAVKESIYEVDVRKGALLREQYELRRTMEVPDDLGLGWDNPYPVSVGVNNYLNKTNYLDNDMDMIDSAKESPDKYPLCVYVDFNGFVRICFGWKGDKYLPVKKLNGWTGFSLNPLSKVKSNWHETFNFPGDWGYSSHLKEVRDHLKRHIAFFRIVFDYVPDVLVILPDNQVNFYGEVLQAKVTKFANDLTTPLFTAEEWAKVSTGSMPKQEVSSEITHYFHTLNFPGESNK